MPRIPFFFIAALVLAGCESEATAPVELPSEGTLTIDATSATDFVYVSFAEGGRIVTVADPNTSTDWHVAFRRYLVKLNGGIGGPGDVAAASLGPNTGATAEQIAALTLTDADAAFAAVTAANLVGVSFVEDGLVEDEGGTWFRFDPQAGTLVANPTAMWKVREADGGFALFRVSALEMSGEDPVSATLEFRRQPVDGVLGAPSSVVVPLTGAPGHVDFSTGSVVPGVGCGWDVVVEASLDIAVNSACNVGTFPIDAGASFSTATRADDAPAYGPFLAIISGAIPNSIGDGSGLFWYNIQGNNRLWPTYNVFLVRTGSDIYKVQVTNYYSATGASGHITIRFEELQ